MKRLLRIPVFETLLVLFLFAGRFKADPRLAWVPVDLTALLFGVSLLAGLLVLYGSGLRVARRGARLVLALLPLLAWLSLSLLWTPGEEYARQKTLYAWTLLLWPLIAGAVILAPSRERLHRFVRVMIVVGVALAADVMWYGLRMGATQLSLMLGSSYLGLGRAVGLSANAAWCLAHRPGCTGRPRLLWMLSAGLMLLALLVMGGRGPLLGTLAGLLAPAVVALFRPDVRRGAARYLRATLLAVALMGVVFGVLSLSGQTPRTLSRVGTLFTEEQDDHSSVERLRYYELAVEKWRESPVQGRGVGSFPVIIDRGDQPYYPHNLFLEMLVELGVVGVLLLLLPLLAGWSALGAGRMGADPDRLLVTTLFVNALFNAQVSEDLTGNRLLFLTLGLLAVSRTRDATAQR